MVNARPENGQLFSLEELAQAAGLIQEEMARSPVTEPLESLVDPLFEDRQSSSVESPAIPETDKVTEEEFLGIVTKGIASLSPEFQTKLVSGLLGQLPRGEQLNLVASLVPELQEERQVTQFRKERPDEAGLISDQVLELPTTRTSEPEKSSDAWVDIPKVRGSILQSLHPDLSDRDEILALLTSRKLIMSVDYTNQLLIIKPKHGEKQSFSFDSPAGQSWLNFCCKNQRLITEPKGVRFELVRE